MSDWIKEAAKTPEWKSWRPSSEFLEKIALDYEKSFPPLKRRTKCPLANTQ